MKNSTLALNRRDVLKLLGGAAFLPLGSACGAAAPRPAVPSAARVARLPSAKRVLGPHENETVAAIAEAILPATETVGARTVRVDEFVELMLAEWHTEAERKVYLDGLAAFDDRCRARFGTDFVRCARAAQLEILTDVDGREWEGDPALVFYGMTKRMTVIGFYTSEAGSSLGALDY